MLVLKKKWRAVQSGILSILAPHIMVPQDDRFFPTECGTTINYLLVSRSQPFPFYYSEKGKGRLPESSAAPILKQEKVS